jgi:ATP-dependent DNA helicase RecQ
VLLWGPEDEKRLSLAKNSAEKNRLAELLRYAGNTGGCRRSALLGLLNYEGSADSPETDCCDVCENKASGYLREEASVMDFFRKNKRAYSVDEAALIMSRSKTVRWSIDEAKCAIKEFIRMEKLKLCKNPLWKKKITVPPGPARH